jgi:hypothetical protein
MADRGSPGAGPARERIGIAPAVPIRIRFVRIGFQGLTRLATRPIFRLEAGRSDPPKGNRTG